MTKYRYYNNQRLILSVTLLIPLAIMMLIIGNLIPQNVYSHANPTSFTPSSNSVVGENGTLPKKAVIVFSERPEPKASYIRVTNSDNERVDKNDYRVSADNPRESSISIQCLGSPYLGMMVTSQRVHMYLLYRKHLTDRRLM